MRKRGPGTGTTDLLTDRPAIADHANELHPAAKKRTEVPVLCDQTAWGTSFQLNQYRAEKQSGGEPANGKRETKQQPLRNCVEESNHFRTVLSHEVWG